jgi:thiol peroxidase
MTTITLKGSPVTTVGSLPKVGTAAPAFNLVKTDLSTVSNADLAGKRIVLNIFPSVDTPTCATSVRKFNVEAGKLENTVVLCVSKDLPFAHGRFCGAEGLSNVHGVSDFRAPEFGKDYGVTITDSALIGLMSRAVVVIDANGTVVYTEQVGEIADGISLVFVTIFTPYQPPP